MSKVNSYANKQGRTGIIALSFSLVILCCTVIYMINTYSFSHSSVVGSDSMTEKICRKQTRAVLKGKTVGSRHSGTLAADGAGFRNTPIDGTVKDTFAEEAKSILAVMSLEEKVYQMFILTPEQLTGTGTVTAAGNITKESLRKYPVGGIIYLAPNLLNEEQTKEMLGNTQKYALETESLPLFLCVDEEGGRVARVSNNPAFGIEKIKPMKEIGSEKEAYDTGLVVGRYLSELGFNVDFAPDADVITNPANTVIGDRSFGDDPDLVTGYAAAFSDGLHEYGVLSTFKHFPGHGATADDTHHGFAYINKTLEELEQAELKPFAAAQAEGVDMVMLSHISVPGIIGDNTPCTLSRYMVTEVLREKLGYRGLIVTDAMNMGAITNAYNNNQAVVAAVKAGGDLILAPLNFKEAANAVVGAVESGDLDIAVIDEAVTRIIIKKLRSCM